MQRAFTIFSIEAILVLASPSFGQSRATRPTPGPSAEEFVNPSLAQIFGGFERVVTTKSNLWFAGLGTASSLAVWPYDDEISSDLKDDDLQELELELPAKLGSFFVVSGAALATQLVGRLAGSPNAANTGLYLFEGFMATQLVTFFPKVLVARTRPDSTNSLSFPSGHSSGMFAVASVLDKRYGHWFGIPSYVIAGVVGISRIKKQKHFATDVLAGATLGTIIGRSFVPDRDENSHSALAPSFGREYLGLSFYYQF